jgi:hypothetical protein
MSDPTTKSIIQASDSQDRSTKGGCSLVVNGTRQLDSQDGRHRARYWDQHFDKRKLQQNQGKRRLQL